MERSGLDANEIKASGRGYRCYVKRADYQPFKPATGKRVTLSGVTYNARTAGNRLRFATQTGTTCRCTGCSPLPNCCCTFPGNPPSGRIGKMDREGRRGESNHRMLESLKPGDNSQAKVISVCRFEVQHLAMIPM